MHEGLAYGLSDIQEAISVASEVGQDKAASEESRKFWHGYRDVLQAASQKLADPQLAADLRQRREAIKQALTHMVAPSLALAEMHGLLQGCRWLLGDWLVATDEEDRVRITHESDASFYEGWRILDDARTYAEARKKARYLAAEFGKEFYEPEGWWIFWPTPDEAVYDYADHIPEGAEPYFDEPYDSEAMACEQLQEMRRHEPTLKLAREV